MKRANIVILGGGAAGLMAACTAAQNKNAGPIVVVEGNPKLGRKLLATGNGRCNLTNMHVSPAHYHGDVRAVEPLLSKYTPEKIRAVFRTLGLITREDSEGRVYPHNLQAAAVLSILRDYAAEHGVRFLLERTAVSVQKMKKGFRITLSDGEEIEAAKCILACGGAASPKHSCSDGYTLAKTLGHTVTPLYPVLTQLVCQEKLKPVSGARCAAEATLLSDGQPVCSETGEVQFTDNSLSGICIFGLSIPAGEFFSTGKIQGKPYKTLSVRLDLLPDLSFRELADYLLEIRANFPDRPAGDFLTGLLNMKVGYWLIQRAGMDPCLPVKRIPQGQIQKLAALIKGWTLEITGTKGWNDAQVTAGGVPLSEIRNDTMESKKAPGLYLTGEMLNIHGDCGGYNLHFAWSTGCAAGADAAGIE